MTAFDFGDIRKTFWKALEDLEDDFMELTDEMRGKLTEWGAALIRGELSLGELRSLLEGEKALLEMTALQKKVETKVLLNTLKKDLIETLIGVVKEAL
ncbi:hypothetical protein LCGC14_2916630 [marine sediment metagenome]|uniref:Uncharacterized protein n=1 Tax=marine sediment metagenome TaxID=412755 RepID=A0A0F8ZXL6_9ZZZZ